MGQTDNPADRQIIQQTDTSEGLKAPKTGVSIGNGGFPADRQTHNQTDNHIIQGRRIRRFFNRKSTMGCRGHPASDRQKEILRGRNLIDNPIKNPEIAEKVRQKNIGKKASEETRKKLSISLKKASLEGRNRGSFKKGNKIPEKLREEKRIMGLIDNPKKRPEIRFKKISDKTRKKLSEARKKEYAEGRRVSSFKKKITEKNRLQRISRAIINNPMKNPEWRKKQAIEKMNGHDKKIEPIKEEIIKDYSNGLGFWDITKKYHLGWKSLTKLLNTEGIKRKPSELKKGKKLGPWSGESRKKLSETRKRLFKEGKIIPSNLGKKFSDEHRKSISIAKLGKKVSLRRKDLVERKNEIIELYAKGKSFEFIANLFKCDHWTIKRLLDRNGVRIRKRFEIQCQKRNDNGTFAKQIEVLA